jgi:hypothetical protein
LCIQIPGKFLEITLNNLPDQKFVKSGRQCRREGYPHSGRFYPKKMPLLSSKTNFSAFLLSFLPLIRAEWRGFFVIRSSREKFTFLTKSLGFLFTNLSRLVKTVNTVWDAITRANSYFCANNGKLRRWLMKFVNFFCINQINIFFWSWLSTFWFAWINKRMHSKRSSKETFHRTSTIKGYFNCRCQFCYKLRISSCGQGPISRPFSTSASRASTDSARLRLPFLPALMSPHWRQPTLRRCCPSRHSIGLRWRGMWALRVGGCF